MFLILFIFQGMITAQDERYLYHINPYDFIRYDLNALNNFGNDGNTASFFKKMDTLLRYGEGNIKIVHIGGSHIQAGTFSGQIRKRLQTTEGDLNAGWGYMFPYRILRTNSPYGYQIRYTGSWQGCRNTDRKRSCTLGIGGVAASTHSVSAGITVILEKENTVDYRFNKIRLFCENENNSFLIKPDSLLVKDIVVGEGYVDIVLLQHTDSLRIDFQKAPESQGAFVIFGLTASSAPNGFVYHSIGVNGAHVPAFLGCELMEQQLASLDPDLVIIGLGINDAYTRRFSSEKYMENYGELVERIKSAAPDAALIFTTNNDSYLYRRYINKNAEKVKEVLYSLAEKHNSGVWDMFSIMGGLNSVTLWEKNNLAQRDRIHFTHEGYLLMGDLFFTALMQRYEKFISENPVQSMIKP